MSSIALSDFFGKETQCSSVSGITPCEHVHQCVHHIINCCNTALKQLCKMQIWQIFIKALTVLQQDALHFPSTEIQDEALKALHQPCISGSPVSIHMTSSVSHAEVYLPVPLLQETGPDCRLSSPVWSSERLGPDCSQEGPGSSSEWLCSHTLAV